MPLQLDLVVEDPSTGYVGAVVGWENGLVILEDRRGAHRAFPVGPGFWIDGKPVNLCIPSRQGSARRHTASGSLAGPEHEAARVALPSRIYVEGRHDAELVERVWGDDLRIEGVVVELLDGVDHLPAYVRSFAPTPDRRLGVLVDHLVAGSKESRIVAEVAGLPGGACVKVLGHPYVDVWQAVRPERLGLAAWPTIGRGTSWKHGILAHLGWAHETQADVARGWQRILATVRSYADLEPALLAPVEELIDFVTVGGPAGA